MKLPSFLYLIPIAVCLTFASLLLQTVDSAKDAQYEDMIEERKQMINRLVDVLEDETASHYDVAEAAFRSRHSFLSINGDSAELQHLRVRGVKNDTVLHVRSKIKGRERIEVKTINGSRWVWNVREGQELREYAREEHFLVAAMVAVTAALNLLMIFLINNSVYKKKGGGR
jgi:hypothetical protein